MTMGTWLGIGLAFKGAVYPLHVLGTIVPTYIAPLTLIEQCPHQGLYL